MVSARKRYLDALPVQERAKLPIEKLIEYVRLFQIGDETISERCALLKDARQDILAARQKIDIALEKLDGKIARYEEAEQTGVLIWSREPAEPTSNEEGESKDE